jgi:hypothetical protein
VQEDNCQFSMADSSTGVVGSAGSSALGSFSAASFASASDWISALKVLRCPARPSASDTLQEGSTVVASIRKETQERESTEPGASSSQDELDAACEALVSLVLLRRPGAGRLTVWLQAEVAVSASPSEAVKAAKSVQVLAMKELKRVGTAPQSARLAAVLKELLQV